MRLLVCMPCLSCICAAISTPISVVFATAIPTSLYILFMLYKRVSNTVGKPTQTYKEEGNCLLDNLMRLLFLPLLPSQLILAHSFAPSVLLKFQREEMNQYHLVRIQ